MTIGTDLIAAERARQIEQLGISAEQDDRYELGVLADAGRAYAELATLPGNVRAQAREDIGYGDVPMFFEDAGDLDRHRYLPYPWPAETLRMEPGDSHADRIRELVKAGALIAAEIDRMQRQIAAADPTQEPRS